MLEEIRDLPVAPEGQEYLVVVNCGWQRDSDVMTALTGAIRRGAYFKDDEPNWAHIVMVNPEEMDVEIGFNGVTGPDVLSQVARIEWQKDSCSEPECLDGEIWIDTGNPEEESYERCPECKGRGFLLK